MANNRQILSNLQLVLNSYVDPYAQVPDQTVSHKFRAQYTKSIMDQILSGRSSEEIASHINTEIVPQIESGFKKPVDPDLGSEIVSDLQRGGFDMGVTDPTELALQTHAAYLTQDTGLSFAPAKESPEHAQDGMHVYA